jgi:serine/threonine protein kinase/Tol biopolymer transport system component
MIGQLLGHYRVLEKIGAGGMGEVFRARDERLGRDVALKLIRPASGSNPDHLRRFEQEARAAASLSHPNILAIYDVGFNGSTPYIVSELLQGKTLRQRLSEGPIPLREASDFALQVAQGLTAAHERLIVHRDLKPENLFLTNDGRVKILDFGVAKLQAPAEDNRAIEKLTTVTKHGAVIGTVAYMSPEQLRAKPVDHRSDIFSFGAILYEMLSGSRAFRGETEVDTITAVLREEPPDSSLDQASIPIGYRDIVKHALEKDPENRFQSAKDLAFALQTLSGSSSGRSVPIAQPNPGTSRLLPWAIVAVLAVATALLALGQLMKAPPSAPVYTRLTSEAGTAYAARFAPGGKSIVYSAAWNGKPVQLFSTVGDFLLAQQLNFNDANLLAISPQNDLAVALHGTHDGQMETVGGMLARAPLAGGSPKELLANVPRADFDPHGSLAVVHDVEGHNRLEFPIGTVLYQTAGWISDVRFSPHGDKIAFMNHPALWDNKGTVAIVDPSSGHVENLTQEWESEQGLAWHGDEIWFTAAEKGNNLNLMAVKPNAKVRSVLDLPVGITLQDIAADGRVLVALNSKRLALAFSTVGVEHDEDLSWHDWNVAKDISADGQFVLFEDASETAGPAYVVALRKLDGTLPIRLGEGSAGGLSPDGKWAISISSDDPQRVTLLPTGPGQPQTVEIGGLKHIQSGFARFLPDGKRFITNANQPGQAARCYALDVSGARPKGITPDGVLCGPSSPDSQYIVGVGPNSISIYPIAGGAPRLLTRLAPNFLVAQWSNDGSAFYGYHKGELPSRIYKADIATGKETLVRELRPGVPAGVVMVAPMVVSRDGKRVAYSYNQTLSVLEMISGLQ